ncbi:MAG TPA: hypothetical protein DG753_05110 [Clostridium sp.]|nr:hypothetical protein [Clostridium sp.]
MLYIRDSFNKNLKILWIFLLSNFSEYVIIRNILECKKFIRDFVKEVVVFKYRMGKFKVTSSIKKYSNSFCIKVS